MNLSARSLRVRRARSTYRPLWALLGVIGAFTTLGAGAFLSGLIWAPVVAGAAVALVLALMLGRVERLMREPDEVELVITVSSDELRRMREQQHS